ncbi:hypothetical protein OEJ84_22780 (plasmid) [Bacillus subtilis]|uniref:Uncharacterized protein n=1 Tax=Bacillus phage vB_BsuS_PJN02 TaxID=2920374 RepID=A0AC61TS12_9CAUD|nr:hypothetical protein [Bacillus subtilis]YP_010681762.1 hypothetical protein PQE76_gp144 [Bacillus phage vB_BsuS_PJN02]UNH58487.1 hypothetical protein [Bacillus phage vB_BsuS_PJN02]WOF32953.1 hypothetical protein OEJ84_22780 [Bacillus subtilis]
MVFTEWYRYTYKEEWYEDYAYLYKFADKTAKKYEKWCSERNIKPEWDG